jgi:hypothetical protein
MEIDSYGTLEERKANEGRGEFAVHQEKLQRLRKEVGLDLQLTPREQMLVDLASQKAQREIVEKLTRLDLLKL